MMAAVGFREKGGRRQSVGVSKRRFNPATEASAAANG